MEERSWSRLAVAGVALAGAGLLVVFLAGFGYHHGWWSLRVAFGRRVLGLPLLGVLPIGTDRKSTRLNSSHGYISYAVFCLKKKKYKSTVNRTHLNSNLRYDSYVIMHLYQKIKLKDHNNTASTKYTQCHNHNHDMRHTAQKR